MGLMTPVMPQDCHGEKTGQMAECQSENGAISEEINGKLQWPPARYFLLLA